MDAAERADRISTFKACTGLDSDELAESCLAAHGWNVHRAVQEVLGDVEGELGDGGMPAGYNPEEDDEAAEGMGDPLPPTAPHVAAPSISPGHMPGPAPRRDAPDAGGAPLAAPATADALSGLLGTPATPALRLLRLPLVLLRGSLGLVGWGLHYGLGLLGRARRWLGLGGGGGDATGGGGRGVGPPGATPHHPAARDAEAIAAAESMAFSAALVAAHPSSSLPPWAAEHYTTALRRAHRTGRLLFVYLHAAGHVDTPTAVCDVLASPRVRAALEAHYIPWGGDPRASPTARELALRLRAPLAPYCAVLTLLPGGATALLHAWTGLPAIKAGLTPGADISTAMAAILESHGTRAAAEAAAAEAEATAAAHARRLRADQDAALEASLQADRLLEAQRTRDADAAKAAAAATAAAHDAARAEAEAAAAAADTVAAALTARRSAAVTALGPEPAVAATTVAIRLPGGGRAGRRYPVGATLGDVYTFVDTLDGVACLRYQLVASFPRRVFGREALENVTLAEADLLPQAALFVESLDD